MKMKPQIVDGAQLALLTQTPFTFFKAAILLCTMLWTSFSLAPLQAQQFLENDLSDYVHSLTGPSGLLMAGDTVHFQLDLGQEDSPLAHVVGLKLSLLRSNLCRFPSSFEPALSGSWLLDPAATQSTLLWDADSILLQLDLWRQDSAGQSGAGQVLRFPVIVTSNDVTAADLRLRLGGLVIVENIDAKTAAAIAASDVLDAFHTQSLAYPNPTLGRLHLNGLASNIASVKLYRLDGRPCQLPLSPVDDGLDLDLSALPAGCYVLRYQQTDHSLVEERIFKR